MPTLITHPSHPIHHLALFSTPVYPGGSFNCDGCGRQGNGFSYRCTTCGFDLHMMCATNPLSFAHQSHPHQINLAFYPPYQTEGFSCDICHKIGSKHWLYRCGACEFDAHMECAMGVNVAPLPHLQHGNSLPVANNNVNIQYQQQPEPGGVNVFTHSQSMGSAKPMQQQQQEASYQQPNGAGNGTVMDAMVQGFVDGAAQQVGQMFVQSIINPDANRDTSNNNSTDPNAGDHDDDSSDSSDPSAINIGSSIMSDEFGTVESYSRQNMLSNV
ncbi:unnamed protein product [Dovyalis caffra]|uniref:DC1 domain-containing protein n=1 Tax=Dovyalis caffra TaxID=77055 RepID=A0AAV1R2E6_9ROSI|nr:unnamed protein product [Dovyalis caffra]